MSPWSAAVLVWTAVPVLGAVAFVGAGIGAVVGGGVTAILLPTLILYFGIHEAVPIATIALVIASISRIAVYRREFDLAVVGWFALGGLPGVIFGTVVFTRSGPGFLTRFFGLVLVGAVVWRRLAPRPPQHFARFWFVPLGAVYGVLSGVSTAMASMPTPFFLAYGLRKEAFVGTMGLCVFFGQCAKLGVLGHANFLTTPVLTTALTLAPFVVFGTWLGKRILVRATEARFTVLVDAFMVASGVLFLIRG